MKLYIVHKFKTYDSSDETYAWANVYKTRYEAEHAINDEIESDIDADMAGSEDCDEDERDEVMRTAIAGAWKEGGNTESHDAILYYGDFTAYYDITETEDVTMTNGEKWAIADMHAIAARLLELFENERGSAERFAADHHAEIEELNRALDYYDAHGPKLDGYKRK